MGMFKLVEVSRPPEQITHRVEPSDEDLVYRTRGGDRRAEAELYRRHAAAIYGLATRLLADPVEARDVVQDTFLTAFRKINQLENIDAFAGWLKMIAVRGAHRRFRRRRLLSWVGLSKSEAEKGLRAIAAPEAPPEVLAELALLEPVLKTMRSEIRLAWSLQVIEGETLPDIAVLLGCSLASVKRYISAAERVLRAHIEGGAR
jgi:RNA polymerase sigma-70 factor, ECF subfamily